MLDFLKISTRNTKQGVIEIYPTFKLVPSTDLMIRGRDFYAIWVEERKLWSTDEQDALQLIDRELDEYADECRKKLGDNIRVLHMWDGDTGMIDKWHRYCQKQCRDSFHMLDSKLIFSNEETTKKDYASKKLSYPLKKGDMPGYEKLLSTLYSPEERHKIEWAIGAIVAGESKTIQKFMVLYGAAGTGKSTVLNIIQKLFDGYYTTFSGKALGSASNAFALEAFKSNPLIAIEHDGDMSRLEDNTRLNSLVSHELMTVNEKFKSTYSNRFKCFLIMGTNKPVRITDGKSGLLRRLIDVTPTGKKLSVTEYNDAMDKINFELGAIAYHCREVYLAEPGKYDNYTPTAMLGASNDFYNYILNYYHIFKKEDGTTLDLAWKLYKAYIEEAKVPYPYQKMKFKEELKNYFWEFNSVFNKEDGERVRSYYKGFRADKFEDNTGKGETAHEEKNTWLIFSEQASVFDGIYKECPAQYANDKEKPTMQWAKVKTKLADLDTTKLHYVKTPENHIVLDFDLKDSSGNKSYEKNLAAANKFPPTYAELSKSGAGIHLHYIYTGDPKDLSRVYDDEIEIKVFTGNSSLRRKLTKCNDIPINTIGSGLPLKGGKKMLKKEIMQTEKGLRTTIKKCLCKEVHPGTKPNVDFIFKILEDAYNSGINYDVSDMYNGIFAFAAQSTHHADYCMGLVDKMRFKSEDHSKESGETTDDKEVIFFDCEVFHNLLVICWKIKGEGKPVVRMINPKPSEVEELTHYRLIGFNCRRYDNHILYARIMGYTTEELFNLSQKIINSPKGENGKYMFGEAYNLSYTDIYDFASAGNKKSLKKLEIEMGIHHQELGLPWDEPVDEKLWNKVADYCVNDVIATEAAFDYLKGDWTARQILADISGLSVNDTTNTLSARIIFGREKHPQAEFNYRDLSKPVGADQYEEYVRKFGKDYKFRIFDDRGLPIFHDYNPRDKLPEGWSILPFFPGYTFEGGKSTYLGEEIGEGGRVYSEPGMYANVWDGDVTGQHPSTIIAEVLFGERYTKAFKEIVDGRVSIKHKAWDDIDELFDGKLKPYVQQVIDGQLTVKELANALKTVVNSVYGLTKASFENPFRDTRNKDNIVAKRGALFMTLLKQEVQKKGFTVCHIKTDSIKIPNATPEIEDFVVRFGKEYGYSFETEARFDRFCLVNKSVYIAKTTDGEWTATGDQFAVPYVFKTLFSHEPIEFNDMCETFAVSKGNLYLDMNEKLPDVSDFEKEMKKYESDYKKGKLSDIHFETLCSEIADEIAAGHDYHFVGRVGEFTPIKPECGGGVLYRVNEGKYYAAPGTTGYRWMESEMVRTLGKEEDIDKSFYTKLIDDAVETISQYGDFEMFVSDEPYIPPDFMAIPDTEEEELPFV